MWVAREEVDANGDEDDRSGDLATQKFARYTRMHPPVRHPHRGSRRIFPCTPFISCYQPRAPPRQPRIQTRVSPPTLVPLQLPRY